MTVFRQPAIVLLACLAALIMAVAVGLAFSFRHTLYVLIGFAAGIALYHASFGFTGAWRRFLREGKGVGLRAQLVMLAVTCLVFFPLMAREQVFGQDIYGFVNPLGLALAFGAFIFGIGMQLGGGCGSGTLYTAGGGSTRMLVTLAAFIAGSLLATAHFPVWDAWPSLPGVSLVESFGAPLALLLCLGLFALCYAASLLYERNRHGMAEITGWSGHWLTGPWPLIAGALALALVNIATLLASGIPWGITSAFALWGAKFAAASGVDVASWPYWQGQQALTQSVFADRTSLMDFALMLGALAAAGLAGKFSPQARLPLLSLLAAIIGGLLMGYGARLATGCNIGAFFSGIASGSLHGFVWLVFAIPGNALGVRLRPLFALD